MGRALRSGLAVVGATVSLAYLGFSEAPPLPANTTQWTNAAGVPVHKGTWSIAASTPAIQDRSRLGVHSVEASQPARFRAEPPPTNVNPDLGFRVDREALEWLPPQLQLGVGDVITRLDGEPLSSTGPLIEAIRGGSEGTSFELQVRRAGTNEETSLRADL
jgi:hypothetical protein